MSAIVIRRFELPPVPVPGRVKIANWTPAASVSSGKLQGGILRFDYFDPADGDVHVESTFEVRIDGLPESFGMSDILAERPEILEELSAVCTATAAILRECQEVTSDAG